MAEQLVGMTPEERDRLAKAEQAITDIRDDIRAIRSDTAELKAALNMGRGGFWVLMKLGVALVAAVSALIAAGVWLFDRFHK